MMEGSKEVQSKSWKKRGNDKQMSFNVCVCVLGGVTESESCVCGGGGEHFGE